MHIHNPIKRQICDKCGKTFQTKYNLNKHVEKEHPTVQAEPLQCLICNTWYRNPDGLKAHNKNTHSNVLTEHRCHICQKVSTTYRALKRHINFNHVRERKFKCTMCEKAFKRSQDLREHISVHTGQPLYTCPNCTLTFASSANMYKHLQRSHKEEYEAQKQQRTPPNIIEQAKSGTGMLSSNRRSKSRILTQTDPQVQSTSNDATTSLNDGSVITSEIVSMPIGWKL